MSPAVAKAAAVRARLWCPPNAVEDTGFHFKNGKPVKAPRKPLHAVYSISVVGPPAGFSSHDRVIKTVCKIFNLRLDELMSRQRNVWVDEARQIAMALTVRLTKNSLPKIGTMFGRNVTTVTHAVEKMRPHINAVYAHMPPDSILEWATAMKERITSPEVVKARKLRRYAPLRTATHCIYGHPFDKANTAIRKDGHRRCRTCKIQADRLRYRKKKARLEA